MAGELKSIGAALAEQTRRQDRSARNPEKPQRNHGTACCGHRAGRATGSAGSQRQRRGDRQALAAIAASINRMDEENRQETAENEDGAADNRLAAEANLGDRALAARIRALEAGVAS